jgi:hypothetical protein
MDGGIFGSNNHKVAKATLLTAVSIAKIMMECFMVEFRLTKKAEPPPTRGVNRDSGTASANGG